MFMHILQQPKQIIKDFFSTFLNDQRMYAKINLSYDFS